MAFHPYAAPPFQRNSPTSRDAATAAEPQYRNGQERIYAYLRASEPRTREELADALSMPLATVCARVAGLLEAQRIRELPGETRLTKSGRKAALVSAYVEPEVGTQFRLGDAL